MHLPVGDEIRRLKAQRALSLSAQQHGACQCVSTRFWLCWLHAERPILSSSIALDNGSLYVGLDERARPPTIQIAAFSRAPRQRESDAIVIAIA